jgi:TonB-dependent starch-binding outer membrane protein SusC
MRARAILSGLILFWFTAIPVAAQDSTTVVGQITTAPDGQPLPGATVSIPSLSLSIITGQDGRYPLPIPADRNKNQTVELRVVFTGLPTKTVQLTLAPGTLTRDVEVGLGFFEEITVGSRTAGSAGAVDKPDHSSADTSLSGSSMPK